MGKLFTVLGAGFGFLSVALGAFAAHALRDRLSPKMLEIFQTGVTYQFYHALALLIVGMALLLWGDATPGRLAGWAFVAGIVLFSGSLYLLAMTGISRLGMIAPLGGALFLLGWLMLVVYFLRIR